MIAQTPYSPMYRLYALALAALLVGCAPEAPPAEAPVVADSLEAAASDLPTATAPVPTAVDSIGIRELERNDHLKRMADSVQSSLGL